MLTATRPQLFSLPEITPSTVRVLITLINQVTGEEKLIDLQCESDRSKHVIPAIHRLFGCQWEIFEWWVDDCPF